MTVRREIGGRHMCGLVLGLMFVSLVARGDVPRQHGMDLDERNRLEIQQIGGALTISVISRERLPLNKPAVVDGREVQRVSNRVELAKVRAEVLVPAAPNYLTNPGDLYRITVDGVCFTPPYHSCREVKAGDARIHLYSELVKIQGRLDGIRREAMQKAAGVSLSVLNKAGYLPGDVSMSVQRSKTGKVRSGGETLEKRRTTVPLAGGQAPTLDQGVPRVPGQLAQTSNEKGTERK